MYALFNNDEFVTLIVNKEVNEALVRLLCSSLGYQYEDCDVIEYEHAFQAGETYSFDSNKKLLLVSIEDQEVKIGEDANENAIMATRKVMTTYQTKNIKKKVSEKGTFHGRGK